MITRRRDGTLPPLTAEQKAHLESIVRTGSAAWQRRARIVLLAAQDDPLPLKDIAAQSGAGMTTVRRWLQRFRVGGMAIFAAPAGPTPSGAETASRTEGPTAPPKPTLSLRALCRRYSVDMAHAGHVAHLAGQLFEATAQVHRLPAEARRLLEAAAMVHDLAHEIDPERYHLLGRDILLNQPLEGFTAAERQMLACITVFHRRKVRPEAEPTFATLQPTQQEEVLALTALLRMANGLDYSHSQTGTLEHVDVVDGTLHLVVGGAYADINSARAEKLADLWEECFHMPVQARGSFSAEAVREDAVWARLEPQLNMPETGRRLLEHYLVLVEQHADSLREGSDEWLPFLERDLARLQGVCRMFGDYYDATALTGFKKNVRWLYRQVDEAVTARAIATMTRLDAPPAAQGLAGVGDLRATFEAQQAEAQKAIRRLRETLDGGRYRRFLAQLLGFSREAGAGVFPGARSDARIGVQAALLIWQEFTRLRVGRDDGLDVPTQWRRVQRFHNVLQYLGHLLGPELRDVLAVIQPLEAQLRDIALGETVLESLRRTLPSDKGQSQEAARAAGETLIAVQQAWLQEARQQLESRWTAFDSQDFRRRLALAVAAP